MEDVGIAALGAYPANPSDFQWFQPYHIGLSINITEKPGRSETILLSSGFLVLGIRSHWAPERRLCIY